MKNLSREELIKTYITAQKLGLANIFIQLIEQELYERNITKKEISKHQIERKIC